MFGREGRGEHRDARRGQLLEYLPRANRRRRDAQRAVGERILEPLDAFRTVNQVGRAARPPLGDLVDALRRVGARIDYLGNEGYPPLHIHSGDICLERPVSVRGSVSSQFVTGLLIALPLTGRAITLEASLGARNVIGGTAPEAVRHQLALARALIG